MSIYLIRHGETDFNAESKVQGQTDIALNCNGRKQAEEIANEIIKSGINFKRIYTSDLKRARETADIIGKKLEADVIFDERIREIKLGDWEGSTWAEIEKKFSTDFTEWFINRRYTKVKNGESYQDLLERTLEFLLSIEEEDDEDILIVSHGANIMSLKSLLNRTDFSDMTQYKHSNASITLLTKSDLIKIKAILEIEKRLRILMKLSYDFLFKTFEESEYLKENKGIKDYRINHSLRVAKNAQLLSKEYKLDEIIMVISAILHDISYATDLTDPLESNNHGRKSAKMSENFINSLDITSYQKEQILIAIAMHADGEKGENVGEISLEAKCLIDCDMMDSMGGIYRIYQMLDWGDFKNRTVYSQVRFLNRRIKEIKKQIPFQGNTELSTKIINEGLNYKLDFYKNLKKQLVSIIEF